MRKKNFSFYLIFIILALWFLVFLVIPNRTEISIDGQTMGTTYEVKIHGIYPKKIDFISSDIDSILLSINQSMSTYIADSEISFINNQLTSFTPFEMSKDFKYVLNKSLEYYINTEGAFDVTIKPLLRLWGFRGQEITKLPSRKKVKEVLKYVGSDNIISNGNNFIKKHSNLELDFGAIAKGYGVDKISNYLDSKGYTNHYVEIGGEITCRGKDWNIQIAYPEYLSNKGYKIVALNDKSIATSGTYNQFVEIDQYEYSHIFDPRLGKPSKNQILSVSVISDKCIDSDALATSLKVMGKNKGLELVNRLNNVECLFILKEDGVLKDYSSNNFSDFLID